MPKKSKAAASDLPPVLRLDAIDVSHYFKLTSKQRTWRAAKGKIKCDDDGLYDVQSLIDNTGLRPIIDAVSTRTAVVYAADQFDAQITNDDLRLIPCQTVREGTRHLWPLSHIVATIRLSKVYAVDVDGIIHTDEGPFLPYEATRKRLHVSPNTLGDWREHCDLLSPPGPIGARRLRIASQGIVWAFPLARVEFIERVRAAAQKQTDREEADWKVGASTGRLSQEEACRRLQCGNTKLERYEKRCFLLKRNRGIRCERVYRITEAGALRKVKRYWEEDVDEAVEEKLHLRQARDNIAYADVAREICADEQYAQKWSAEDLGKQMHLWTTRFVCPFLSRLLDGFLAPGENDAGHVRELMHMTPKERDALKAAILGTTNVKRKESKPAKRNKGGRKRDPLTWEIMEFCYTQRNQGKSIAQVFDQVCKRWPDRAPEDPSQITRWARRYAEGQGLKWPVN